MEGLKLFGRWDFEGVEVQDKALAKYIDIQPIFVPHTHGRHSKKQFAKSRINVVERLINRMMRSGQGTRKVAGKFIRGEGAMGKKQTTVNIIREAFEIIEQRTKKNPVQVLVDAVSKSGPREETTTIIYGGIRYHQAVDVSSQRRVDFALKYLSLGAFAVAFNSKKSTAECLADEIIWAAAADQKSYAIQRKDETERIAQSSR
ncbi:30S ribosomal protein S7 [uncultured archaeon]|nr:30S ribosomal protein S7 [uncultured archaeon]